MLSAGSFPDCNNHMRFIKSSRFPLSDILSTISVIITGLHNSSTHFSLKVSLFPLLLSSCLSYDTFGWLSTSLGPDNTSPSVSLANISSLLSSRTFTYSSEVALDILSYLGITFISFLLSFLSATNFLFLFWTSMHSISVFFLTLCCDELCFCPLKMYVVMNSQ